MKKEKNCHPHIYDMKGLFKHVKNTKCKKKFYCITYIFLVQFGQTPL